MQVTARDEKMMADAMRMAVGFVDAGDGPDEAIAKAAAAGGLTPGRIELLARAYNVAACDDIRDDGKTTAEKLGECQLADAARIVSLVYPDGPVVPKEASADPFAEGPSWLAPKRIKKASRPNKAAVDNRTERDKAVAAVGEAEKLARRLAAERTEARVDLERRIDRVAYEYRKAASVVPPLAAVEKSAALRHGEEAATALFDLVAAAAPAGIKRAADGPVLLREPLRQGIGFLAEVDAIFEAGVKLASLEADKADADARWAEAKERYKATLRIEKEAAGPFAGSVYGTMAGMALARGLGDGPQNAALHNSAIDKALLEFDDPAHLDELRKIRTLSAITQATTDPKDSLSGYGPERVIDTYNSFAEAFPRLADHPYLYKPALRRALAGSPELFEVGELAKLEKLYEPSKQPSPPPPAPAPQNPYG